MRKIFLLLILPLGLLMSSCLKKSNYKPSPIAPGFSMFQNVQMQNLLSLDAANVAFRLNTLLSTARDQGIANDKLNTVTAEYHGMTVNVANELLGSADISEENGVWTLLFNGSSTPSEGFPRSGKLVIDTKGNTLLGALPAGESWDITGDSDFRVLMGGIAFVMDYKAVFYRIVHPEASTRAWRIDVTGFSVYQSVSSGEPVKSDWLMSLNVSQNGTSESYAEVRKSTYTVSGSANGKLFGWPDIDFQYETETPLQYKASCDHPVLIGGKEKASAPMLVVTYPASYPYGSVSVQWADGVQGECSNSYKVYYGPYTFDSVTGQTTGGVE